MNDPHKRDHDKIMATAVLLPLNDFNPGTSRIDGRVERLKTMITNTVIHDKEVRNRMFTATFSPEAIKANENRPELSPQTTPEVLAALDSVRRAKEFNARALESKNFLHETLKKYDGSASASAPSSRRSSLAVAPVALMSAGAGMAMEGVERTGVAPTAPMMNVGAPATVAPKRPVTSSSNIDASRDPRRR